MLRQLGLVAVHLVDIVERNPTSSSCDRDSQTQHMMKLGLVLHCLVSLPGPGPLLWTSAALHKPNVLVSLRRHEGPKGGREDVS